MSTDKNARRRLADNWKLGSGRSVDGGNKANQVNGGRRIKEGLDWGCRLNTYWAVCARRLERDVRLDEEVSATNNPKRTVLRWWGRPVVAKLLNMQTCTGGLVDQSGEVIRRAINFVLVMFSA